MLFVFPRWIVLGAVLSSAHRQRELLECASVFLGSTAPAARAPGGNAPAPAEGCQGQKVSLGSEGCTRQLPLTWQLCLGWQEATQPGKGHSKQWQHLV